MSFVVSIHYSYCGKKKYLHAMGQVYCLIRDYITYCSVNPRLLSVLVKQDFFKCGLRYIFLIIIKKIKTKNNIYNDKHFLGIHTTSKTRKKSTPFSIMLTLLVCLLR